MSDLVERAKEMPSSLNDACRTIEVLCDEIDRLRAGEATRDELILTLIGERDILRAQFASARKALEQIAGLIDREDGEPLDDAIEIANRALSDENAK